MNNFLHKKQLNINHYDDLITSRIAQKAKSILSDYTQILKNEIKIEHIDKRAFMDTVILDILKNYLNEMNSNINIKQIVQKLLNQEFNDIPGFNNKNHEFNKLLMNDLANSCFITMINMPSFRDAIIIANLESQYIQIYLMHQVGFILDSKKIKTVLGIMNKSKYDDPKKMKGLESKFLRYDHLIIDDQEEPRNIINRTYYFQLLSLDYMQNIDHQEDHLQNLFQKSILNIAEQDLKNDILTQCPQFKEKLFCHTESLETKLNHFKRLNKLFQQANKQNILMISSESCLEGEDISLCHIKEFHKFPQNNIQLRNIDKTDQISSSFNILRNVDSQEQILLNNNLIDNLTQYIDNIELITEQNQLNFQPNCFEQQSISKGLINHSMQISDFGSHSESDNDNNMSMKNIQLNKKKRNESSKDLASYSPPSNKRIKFANGDDQKSGLDFGQSIQTIHINSNDNSFEGIKNKLVQYRQNIYQSIYKPTIECHYYVNAINNNNNNNIKKQKSGKDHIALPDLIEEEEYDNNDYEIAADIKNISGKKVIKKQKGYGIQLDQDENECKNSIMKRLLMLRGENLQPKKIQNMRETAKSIKNETINNFNLMHQQQQQKNSFNPSNYPIMNMNSSNQNQSHYEGKSERSIEENPNLLLGSKRNDMNLIIRDNNAKIIFVSEDLYNDSYLSTLIFKQALKINVLLIEKPYIGYFKRICFHDENDVIVIIEVDMIQKSNYTEIMHNLLKSIYQLIFKAKNLHFIIIPNLNPNSLPSVDLYSFNEKILSAQIKIMQFFSSISRQLRNIALISFSIANNYKDSLQQFILILEKNLYTQLKTLQLTSNIQYGSKKNEILYKYIMGLPILHPLIALNIYNQLNDSQICAKDFILLDKRQLQKNLSGISNEIIDAILDINHKNLEIQSIDLSAMIFFVNNLIQFYTGRIWALIYIIKFLMLTITKGLQRAESRFSQLFVIEFNQYLNRSKPTSLSKRSIQQSGENIPQKNPALLLFEDDLYAELFNARCHDTGEAANVEKAKLFKDELLRLNQQSNRVLSLNSLRLGINAIISLSNTLPLRNFLTLNLADNSISDYGMHAIKNIIANSKIENLNLASNMISDVGLEMLVGDLTKNSRLKSLDLGILEGSIRKNSFGIQGAKCIAAILLHNKNLETLKLQDNDLGSVGGELIGAGLSQNKALKYLKISENDLKSEGSEHILKNGKYLEVIDLGKNGISAKTGTIIGNYIENNQNLKKINLEYNELGAKGIEGLANAIITTHSLRVINLRGNCIRDEGAKILADALEENITLEELDISLNEITPIGSECLSNIVPRTGIKIYNLSKNFLGDEAIIHLANKILEFQDICRLTKLDFSSSRIGDDGVLYFFKELQDYSNLMSLKLNDNFISEKIEKVLVELLEDNKNLTELLLQGNRISLSCLSRIRKILKRNQKLVEDKEPNRLKVELYRLQYEQKKISEEKERLKQQEKDLAKFQDNKESLLNEIQRFQANEEVKRANMNERIEEQRQILKKKLDLLEEKNEEFKKLKSRHEGDMGYINKDVETAQNRKNELDNELKKILEEKSKTEESLSSTVKELKEQIEFLKKKGDDLKKRDDALIEELRKLKNSANPNITGNTS